MSNIIAKTLSVNFEITKVVLNGADISKGLTSVEIREVMYATESEVFKRAVNEESGKFTFKNSIDGFKYEIDVKFKKESKG